MNLKNNFVSKQIDDKEFTNVELKFVILVVTRNLRLRTFIRKVLLTKKIKSVINRLKYNEFVKNK